MHCLRACFLFYYFAIAAYGIKLLTMVVHYMLIIVLANKRLQGCVCQII
jgi:hypothetical protein